LLVLFLAGGGTLLLVIALAVTIGRRIAGPIAGLEGIAAALEDGRWVAPAHTGIQETDLVARALCSASRDLNRRREELSQTAGALRLSERRLQVLSEDLLRAVTERTKLLDRMVTTQETERRRIARELHDRLGQYVAAILLGLNVADQALRCDQKGQQNLAELKALTSAMSREVHELSWELRPTALDDLGLEAVVADYLAEWSERFHLDVDFVSNLHGKRLSPPIEMTLYRVLQEAMTNVAKHACANKVGVILEANEGEGRLIVEDDGIGFGGERSGAAAVSMSGFGLINIRERLSLVGGSLSIETAPNRGTTLFCRVPQ
jgi:signal transduction histidine kinase